MTWVYAALWAFRIRKAISVQTYRDQALGIGMIVVSLVLFYSVLLLAPFSLIILPFFWLESVVILFWIDSSVKAGRRADPFLRDTARWSTLRLLAWGLNLAGIGGGILILTLSSLGVKTGSVTSIFFSSIGYFVVFGPIAATSLFGGVVLTIISRRSRNFVLRNHLRWFGTFIAVVFLGITSAVLLNQVLGLDGNFALVPAGILEGYFLYKSVKSLVPLNRISTDASLDVSS